MPHQCLSCGETFEDGSSDLLDGCPGCEGTQFFFTEEPLDPNEREELQEEADQRNVNEMLQEVLDGADKSDLDEDLFSRDAWEDWIRLRKDEDGEVHQEDVAFETLTPEEEKTELRASEAVQVSLEDVQEADAPEPAAEPAPPADEHVPAGDVEPIAPDAQEAEPGRPSTLNIENPGKYEIDVERLMEDSPVIVERDGSFVIHLPSVFERSK